MPSHLTSKPEANVAQKLESVYVADSMPLDAKTIWDSFADFNTKLPADAKWHGMLVFIVDENKWFMYDKTSDELQAILINNLQATLINNVIPAGKLQVWKAPGNLNIDVIEANDVVEGFIEGAFVKGTYNSGDTSLLASYYIWDSTT